MCMFGSRVDYIWLRDGILRTENIIGLDSDGLHLTQCFPSLLLVCTCRKASSSCFFIWASSLLAISTSLFSSSTFTSCCSVSSFNCAFSACIRSISPADAEHLGSQLTVEDEDPFLSYAISLPKEIQWLCLWWSSVFSHIRQQVLKDWTFDQIRENELCRSPDVLVKTFSLLSKFPQSLRGLLLSTPRHESKKFIPVSFLNRKPTAVTTCTCCSISFSVSFTFSFGEIFSFLVLRLWTQLLQQFTFLFF